jgi:hypothetical protein
MSIINNKKQYNSYISLSPFPAAAFCAKPNVEVASIVNYAETGAQNTAFVACPKKKKAQPVLINAFIEKAKSKKRDEQAIARGA